MAVSIIQASINSLADWISDQLGPGVAVSSRWPSPDKKLPPRAVTIITAGRRNDEPVETRLLSQIDAPDGLNKILTWQVKMCDQPIQIDVWARTDPDRDDLIAKLDKALNAGESSLTGAYNPDPARAGLLLLVQDGWLDTTADFMFDGPEFDDDSDSEGRSEYRARITGVVHTMLTVTKASAKQKVINFKQKVHETATAEPGDLNEITTITETDITHSVGS